MVARPRQECCGRRAVGTGPPRVCYPQQLRMEKGLWVWEAVEVSACVAFCSCLGPQNAALKRGVLAGGPWGRTRG